MTELDEMWSQMLSRALENANATGRRDVADYLSLKAANDAVRRAGVTWLFDTLTAIAAAANRLDLAISIENTNPHSFTYHGASLAGQLTQIRYGVRCLRVEAGWTRTPTDGFMRGGALAIGRLTHRGLPKANAEIALILADKLPVWKVVSEEKAGGVFDSTAVRSHLAILTDGLF